MQLFKKSNMVDYECMYGTYKLFYSYPFSTDLQL
jgi:hypothetical protein